jgi:hypothetical protein
MKKYFLPLIVILSNILLYAQNNSEIVIYRNHDLYNDFFFELNIDSNIIGILKEGGYKTIEKTYGQHSVEAINGSMLINTNIYACSLDTKKINLEIQNESKVYLRADVAQIVNSFSLYKYSVVFTIVKPEDAEKDLLKLSSILNSNEEDIIKENDFFHKNGFLFEVGTGINAIFREKNDILYSKAELALGVNYKISPILKFNLGGSVFTSLFSSPDPLLFGLSFSTTYNIINFGYTYFSSKNDYQHSFRIGLESYEYLSDHFGLKYLIFWNWYPFSSNFYLSDIFVPKNNLFFLSSIIILP